MLCSFVPSYAVAHSFSEASAADVQRVRDEASCLDSADVMMACACADFLVEALIAVFSSGVGAASAATTSFFRCRLQRPRGPSQLEHSASGTSRCGSSFR